MGKKILLADDSITIQKVIELTFSDEDFEVTTVGNGRLALERLQEMRPDIVLCDIIMPEKDGYEVCDYIKKSPTLSSVPVLLLTGAFEPFDQERAQRVGADGYLAKPFEPQALIAKVKDLLSQAPTRILQRAAPTPAPPPAPAAPAAPAAAAVPVAPRVAAPPPPPPPAPEPMEEFLEEAPLEPAPADDFYEVAPETPAQDFQAEGAALAEVAPTGDGFVEEAGYEAAPASEADYGEAPGYAEAVAEEAGFEAPAAEAAYEAAPADDGAYDGGYEASLTEGTAQQEEPHAYMGADEPEPALADDERATLGLDATDALAAEEAPTAEQAIEPAAEADEELSSETVPWAQQTIEVSNEDRANASIEAARAEAAAEAAEDAAAADAAAEAAALEPPAGDSELDYEAATGPTGLLDEHAGASDDYVGEASAPFEGALAEEDARPAAEAAFGELDEAAPAEPEAEPEPPAAWAPAAAAELESPAMEAPVAFEAEAPEAPPAFEAAEATPPQEEIALPPPEPPAEEPGVPAAAPVAAVSFADLSPAPVESAAVPSMAAEVGVPADMVEKIAHRVVAQVSEKVIREIAWEVIPDLAENLIRKEIERLKSELAAL